MEIGHPIVRIKCVKGKEFDNVAIDLFLESKGIKHEFSTPRIPQQNGVIERKNRVLQEMTKVMIHMHNAILQF